MNRTRTTTAALIALVATLLVVGPASAQPTHPSPPPPDPEVYLDRSGFNELLINQAVFGLQLGGALTTAIFPDPLRQDAGFILGLGAGIALPLVLTAGKPVPSADVVYINQMQRLALANGFGLFHLVYPSGPFGLDERRLFHGTMAAGSLIGLGAAILTKDMIDLVPAQASALGAGYWYGALTGALLMITLDVVESERAFWGSLLGFSNAGLVAAFLLRDNFMLDRSAMVWTTIGGTVGLAMGSALGWLFGGQNVSPQVMAGSALSGFWIGAVVTYLYLLPEPGFAGRADLASGSLLNIDDRGHVGLGIPTPSATLLPPRVAGASPDLAATVNLLEWRTR